MLHILRQRSKRTDNAVLRTMFEARKRVFIDLLRWDLPVLDGRYEIDAYDTPDADYLILTDAGGRHLASTRLLVTTGPHILADLFPELCEADVPTGPNIFEITRFCLEPRRSARDRRQIRNRLVSALVDHALASGITQYTGVAQMGWLQQILAFGWRCRPLGMPQPSAGAMLGALSIHITPETPTLLAAAGIYTPSRLELEEHRHAA